MKLIIGTLTIAAITILACTGQPDDSTAETSTVDSPQPLNPNGDSELAIFMRHMYDDGMAMKAAIQNGEPVTSNLDLETLYTPNATEPEKVQTGTYRAYAKAYEDAYRAVLEKEGEERKAAYRTLVNTCKACHKSMCPGPLMRIEKMEL